MRKHLLIGFYAVVFSAIVTVLSSVYAVTIFVSKDFEINIDILGFTAIGAAIFILPAFWALVYFETEKKKKDNEETSISKD